MGIQRFGAKKIRKFQTITGIEWDMVWNHQGNQWLARTVIDGKCQHATIQHGSYEVVWEPDAICMSTCPGRNE